MSLHTKRGREAVALLDESDSNREVNEMLEYNNVLYIATGTSSAGGSGIVYMTTNGEDFEAICITSQGAASSANAIIAAMDGTLYFGSSSGSIYTYKNNTCTLAWSDIGDTITSLAIWSKIATTGPIWRSTKRSSRQYQGGSRRR